MAGLHIDIKTANPKQIAFFEARERFVAYGGARGGGKSWSLRWKAVMLAVYYPGIKILLLRRTYPELQENHTDVLISILSGFAQYSDKRKAFLFPNGSIIKLGYCASEHDVDQYQGQEYAIIMMDEATQFTEYQYTTLTACLRGANKFPKRMYLTCNPGGVGHEWVKRLFITRKYREKEKPEDYRFIPATVFDNKILLENDPGYVDMLNNLSETLRAAWRDGNWDMLAGQYFSEFDRAVHVVDPFQIPDWWRRYRAIDYGLDCLACVWIAADDLGNYYLYREYAEPDKIISVGAEDILDYSKGEDISRTFAPPDLWGRSQESARSKADLFREAGLNLYKAGNNRESGWLAIKELLKVYETTHQSTSVTDPLTQGSIPSSDGYAATFPPGGSKEGEKGEGEGEARLKIFATCPRIIEHLTALQRDPKRPNDCLTEPHEITHLPDALRYFATGYIGRAKKPVEKDDMKEYKKRRIAEVARRGF